MTQKTRPFWAVAWVAGAVASLAWILNFEQGTFWTMTALVGVAIALVMVVLALVTQRREAPLASTASDASMAPERRLALLERLAELRREGILTDTEFQEERDRLGV